MKIVAAIVRRFSVRLMLAAIVALAFQAGGTLGHESDGSGDCPNGLHLSQPTTHDAGKVVHPERAGVGHDHGVPCTSACCGVACSMAVLAFAVIVQLPASTPSVRYSSVFDLTEGIDVEATCRPPRPSPPV